MGIPSTQRIYSRLQTSQTLASQSGNVSFSEQLTGAPVTSGAIVVVAASSGVYVQKMDTVAVLVSDVDLPGVPEDDRMVKILKSFANFLKKLLDNGGVL